MEAVDRPADGTNGELQRASVRFVSRWTCYALPRKNFERLLPPIEKRVGVIGLPRDGKI